jgi:succinylglutamate desuccinylase
VGKKSFGALSAFVLVWALLAVPFAQATEVTRESYKEAVEPICKTNTEANEKILKGVRAEFKAGKLKVAAGRFSHAATALKKTVKQLKAVPQPTADEAKLAKWLKYVEEEANLFQRTAKKLRANDKAGAQAMVIRLTHNANQANNQVLGFEFRYCRFEPSKFT